LFIEVILFKSSHFFKLIITDDGSVSKQIITTISNSLNAKIKTNCLKQTLSGNFIKPIELESEGEEIDVGQAILDRPILPCKSE